MAALHPVRIFCPGLDRRAAARTPFSWHHENAKRQSVRHYSDTSPGQTPLSPQPFRENGKQMRLSADILQTSPQRSSRCRKVPERAFRTNISGLAHVRDRLCAQKVAALRIAGTFFAHSRKRFSAQKQPSLRREINISAHLRERLCAIAAFLSRNNTHCSPDGPFWHCRKLRRTAILADFRFPKRARTDG